MQIHAICDCNENKVITGQMDGEMIWREKEFSERLYTPEMHQDWLDKQSGVNE